MTKQSPTTPMKTHGYKQNSHFLKVTRFAAAMILVVGAFGFQPAQATDTDSTNKVQAIDGKVGKGPYKPDWESLNPIAANIRRSGPRLLKPAVFSDRP